MKNWLRKEKNRFEMKELLQMNSGRVGYKAIIVFLSKTGLSRRI